MKASTAQASAIHIETNICLLQQQMVKHKLKAMLTTKLCSVIVVEMRSPFYWHRLRRIKAASLIELCSFVNAWHVLAI